MQHVGRQLRPNGASDTLNAFIAAGGLEAMLALVSKQDAMRPSRGGDGAERDDARPRGMLRDTALGADAVLASSLTRATDEDVAEHAAGAWQTCARTTRSPPPPNPELEERLRLRRLRDVIEAFQSKRGVGVVQKVCEAVDRSASSDQDDTTIRAREFGEDTGE